MSEVPAGLTRTLEHLESRQLVRTLNEAEPTFSFKHNLVQQVAYESLLASDRRTLHRAVAETLERLYPERTPELAEILAAHFAGAGEEARALAYTTEAGVQALRRFATAEAADLFARAVELAGPAGADDERWLHLYQQRGRALELGGDYAAAMKVHQELETLGRRRGSRRLELAGIISATSLQAVPTPLYDEARGLANARRAVALAEEIGEPAGQAKAYWLMMLVLNRTNPREAVAAGETSLGLARRHGLREQEAFTLNDIQSNYQLLGEPDRALEALEAARPIWSELDNLPMLADNLASTSMLHAILAEYELGLVRGREALAVSERTGNLWGQSYSRVGIGLTHFARGELGPAIREMSLSIDTSVPAGFVYPQVALRAILAIAYGQAGDLPTASRLVAQIRVVEKANPIRAQNNGDSAAAWIAVAEGDLDEARRLLQGKGTSLDDIAQSMVTSPVPLTFAVCAYHLACRDYGQALEVVDRLIRGFETFQWRGPRGMLRLARGRALRGLGRQAEARADLQAAFDEMAATGVGEGLWEVEAELSTLAAEAGNSEEAARWIRASAAHARQVAAGLTDLGLADRFLAQPHIQSILLAAAGRPT